eukprot:1679773-Prymnesium_polylepis.1
MRFFHLPAGHVSDRGRWEHWEELRRVLPLSEDNAKLRRCVPELDWNVDALGVYSIHLDDAAEQAAEQADRHSASMHAENYLADAGPASHQSLISIVRGGRSRRRAVWNVHHRPRAVCGAAADGEVGRLDRLEPSLVLKLHGQCG